MKHVTIVLSALGLLAVSTSLFAADDPAVLDLGKVSYDQYCARCHGPSGKGDGPDAKRVPVTPRNFTRGAYKFRTTASGTPPSDADLINTIGRGLPGSGMPSFANLGLDVKQALVAYVKTFSDEFKTYQPEPIAAPNTKAKVNLSQGKDVFTKLQCALCHGDAGRANGTSAPTLVDSWGDPLKAANLTQEWTYRGGSAPKDIYYRLMTGLAGTPMPAYDSAVSPDEAWQLAHYVASLQQKGNWAYQTVAARVTEPLPSAADSSVWSKAIRTDINMQGAYLKNNRQQPASVNAVAVQAVFNDDAMVFKLSWNDTTKDTSDQLLLAFKPADSKSHVRETLATAYQDNSSPFDMMIWSAQSPNVVRQKVDNLRGVLRSSENGKTLKAEATYNDGLWTLVFTRPFEKGAYSASDVSITMGLAGWNGGSGETGEKHSSSQWLPLYLNKPKSTH